jgi:hypothetical protein
VGGSGWTAADRYNGIIEIVIVMEIIDGKYLEINGFGKWTTFDILKGEMLVTETIWDFPKSLDLSKQASMVGCACKKLKYAELTVKVDGNRISRHPSEQGPIDEQMWIINPLLFI